MTGTLLGLLWILLKISKTRRRLDRNKKLSQKGLFSKKFTMGEKCASLKDVDKFAPRTREKLHSNVEKQTKSNEGGAKPRMQQSQPSIGKFLIILLKI